MTTDTAIVLAAIVLAMVWPLHQLLEIRALRYTLARQREQLHQHGRAIVQLQGAAVSPPTSIGQPMPTIGRSRVGQQAPPKVPPVSTSSSQNRPKPPTRPRPLTDPDPTLRLRRPPALDDITAAILRAGRPLTQANLTAQLERDTRSEIRAAMLAGTIEMVRTHDDEPCYWPTSHPRPGDTVRLSRMPILPGVTP